MGWEGEENKGSPWNKPAAGLSRAARGRGKLWGRMLGLRSSAGHRRGCGSSDMSHPPRLLCCPQWLGNLLGAFGKGLGIPHCEHSQRVPRAPPPRPPFPPAPQAPQIHALLLGCSWLTHTGDGEPKAILGVQGRREAAHESCSSHGAFRVRKSAWPALYPQREGHQPRAVPKHPDLSPVPARSWKSPVASTVQLWRDQIPALSQDSSARGRWKHLEQKLHHAVKEHHLPAELPPALPHQDP